VKILNDPNVTVRYVGAIGEVQDRGLDRKSLPPPPLNPEVFQPLEKIAGAMWPGMPVVPDMSTGASDGIYTNAAGLPTYAVGGVAIDRGDIRAHGKDERIGIDSYYTGVDFYYKYLKAVTSK